MSERNNQLAMESYLQHDTQQDNIQLAHSSDASSQNSGGPKREVLAWIWVNALDDINMSDETFYVDFELFIFWLPTDEEKEKAKEKEKKDDDESNNKLEFEDESLSYFYDNFALVNGTSVDMRLQSQGKIINGGIDPYGTKLTLNKSFSKDSTLYYIKYSIKGTFKERFELHNFPFDVQDLQIHLQHNQHKATKRLNVNFDERKYFLHDSWLSHSTISPNVHLDEYTQEGFQTVNYCSVNGFDHIEFKIKIARKYSVYFWKVGIYMLILTMSSIGVFCLNTDTVDPVDQLSLLFTLLLTGVAVQFVVGSWLPILSYVTLLDQYITVAFLTMFTVVVFIYIFDIFEVDISDDGKLGVALTLFGIFTLCQIGFCILFYIRRKEEMKKIEQFDTSLPIEGSDTNNNDKKEENEQEKSANILAKTVLHITN